MLDTITIILAFISGGVICAIVQLLIDFTGLTPARILVLLVVSGVVIYAIGIWDTLIKVFGAGVSVPLLGFGANIGKGVKEAVDKEGLIGVLKGGLTATSAGITLTLFLGLLFSLIGKSRAKRF